MVCEDEYHRVREKIENKKKRQKIRKKFREKKSGAAKAEGSKLLLPGSIDGSHP